jgi:hypothetical protein
MRADLSIAASTGIKTAWSGLAEGGLKFGQVWLMIGRIFFMIVVLLALYKYSGGSIS